MWIGGRTGLEVTAVPACSKGANPSGARLEAWTSALEAELYKDGRVLSRRLDLIVGPDARAGKGASHNHVILLIGFADGVMRARRIQSERSLACSQTACLGIHT